MIDLDTRRTASLATIPGRSGELLSCLESLLPQMTAVHVTLNYGEVPIPPEVMQLLIRHRNLIFHLSDNSLGDGAKFSQSEHTQGYQFICDDDLIYPPCYAEAMMEAIERYNRRAVVGLGGSVITGPVKSYYNDRHKHGHALRDWTKDTHCNVLVTCALAFHSSTTRMPMAEIRHANMADIFFALHCQQNKVPMVCLAHTADFLAYHATMRGKWTICGCRREHDHIQAQYLNECKDWRVYKP